MGRWAVTEFFDQGAHHAFPAAWDYRFAATGADRISRPHHQRQWKIVSLSGLRAGRLRHEAELAGHSLSAWRGGARRRRSPPDERGPRAGDPSESVTLSRDRRLPAGAARFAVGGNARRYGPRRAAADDARGPS